eukprot:1139961-Pelagomonas_calceolata.AAC.1
MEDKWQASTCSGFMQVPQNWAKRRLCAEKGIKCIDVQAVHIWEKSREAGNKDKKLSHARCSDR